MVPSQPRSPRPRLSGRVVLLLACSLAFLRLARLGEWSLWIDEALTWTDAHHGLGTSDLFNPLGYRLVVAVADLAGGSPDEFALRLLPALAGIACVPLTAWALAPLIGKRRAAWAALLLAVSAWHLFWSQTARFYTLAQVTSLLGAGLALRGLWLGRSWWGGRAWTYIGFVLCAFAASFHPSAALLVPTLAVGAFAAGGTNLARRRRALEALIVLGLLGLASAPWTIQPFQHHILQKPSPGLIAGPLHLGMTAAYFFTPLLSVVAVWAAVRAFTQRDPAARLLAVLVCAAFAISVLLATQAQLTAQYLFFSLPFLCGLVASLLTEGPFTDEAGADKEGGAAETEAAVMRRIRPIEGALLAGLVCASLASCGLYFTSRAGERPRWREAYQYVDAMREPGDLVAGMASPIAEFYLGEGNTELRAARTIAPVDRYHALGPRRWRRDGRRTWLVVRPQWFADLKHEDAQVLQEFLQRDCRLMRRFEVQMDGRDLDLLVYLED